MAKKKTKARTASRSVRPGKSIAKTSKAASTASDWRVGMLAEVRRLIHDVDSGIVEERKWVKPTNSAGVPVWSRSGIICTGEMYKGVVKLTFFRGASLADPSGLFNAGFAGGTRRAIDIREGEKLDAKAFQALIQTAVQENLAASAPESKAAPKKVAMARAVAAPSKRVKLLSGGNPQIAKADGDAPVQAYLAAIPGWKNGVGRRLDEIIERTVPNVIKAVKWNSPFYGIQDQGWFLAFHVHTRYLRVSFFTGALLQPPPPGPSKVKNVRYLDIHENDDIDTLPLASWLKQAAAIPGWDPSRRT